MTNLITVKNNGVSGTVPTSLSLGEPALCRPDGRLYFGTDAGVELLGTPQEVIQLTADGTSVASVSLTDIATLQCPVLVGERWIIQWDFAITIATTTTATFGGVVAVTTGTTGNWRAEGLNGAPNTGAGTIKRAINPVGTALANTVFGNIGSTTLTTWLRIFADVNVVSTAGVVKVQLNGSLSTAAVLVKAGSSMQGWRLK